MKKFQLIISFSVLLIQLLNSNFVSAQNVGIGTNTPHSSAQLDVTSNQRGFLPPRMTFAERNNILNPAQGLIIYCTNCGTRGEAQIFDGTEWTNISGGLAKIPTPAYDTTVPSVTIGTQIWSSKNLDVKTYRNGDSIPQISNATKWAGGLTTGAWCWYNNDSATYAATYGRLYNWYAVNDPRGLAPQGWHVPNEAEWNILVKYLDAAADTTCQGCSQSTIAGGAMKTTSGWKSPISVASNSSGFTGLPGGYRDGYGGFFDVGGIGIWWSASESAIPTAGTRYLTNNLNSVYRFFPSKFHGLSVRVVRD